MSEVLYAHLGGDGVTFWVNAEDNKFFNGFIAFDRTVRYDITNPYNVVDAVEHYAKHNNYVVGNDLFTRHMVLKPINEIDVRTNDNSESGSYKYYRYSSDVNSECYNKIIVADGLSVLAILTYDEYVSRVVDGDCYF